MLAEISLASRTFSVATARWRIAGQQLDLLEAAGNALGRFEAVDRR